METKYFNFANTRKLDAPERLVYLPPAEVVTALNLSSQDTIADVGAGTGYFAIPLAQAATTGKVYAVDASQEMLSLLKQKLDGISNVELIHASAGSTSLPTGACDLVFFANVWHEFDDRSTVLGEAMRLLKRPGRIAILDWRPDVERVSGPPLEHRLTPRNTEEELAAQGFQQIASQTIGRYSWLVQATILVKQ